MALHSTFQYSCLENPMDGGAWEAAVHGVAKSRTRLSGFPFTFHFHALEKEMETHSSEKESEIVVLKLNIQKIKITASGPITSWQIDGETVETVAVFIWGHQNHYRY